MKTYLGQIASEGIVVGEIFKVVEPNNKIEKEVIENMEKEKVRFLRAVKKASHQIQELCKQMIQEMEKTNVDIFEFHLCMLKDKGFINGVLEKIENEKFKAEYAVYIIGEKYANGFEIMEDEYFRARAMDIRDVAQRIIDALLDKKIEKIEILKKCILCVDDLSPSQTVKMDKSKVIGMIINKGSTNSHVAILSRAMGVPAMMGVDMSKDCNGKTAILNCFQGEILVEPNADELENAVKVQEEVEKKKKEFSKYKNIEPKTKSGKKIDLFANVGGLSDVLSAVQNGASGIGLFRTEFVYLDSEDFPTEEAQLLIYKNAIQIANGIPVSIRTLDIGADKILPYFRLHHENNPALGYRGVRVSFKYLDVFKVQLRAILRASTIGKVVILIPMVVDVWEIKQVKKIIEDVKAELRNEKIPYGDYKIGIMVETPAAVMMADEFAQEVDFFSIGTNDLTQYTFATDRENNVLYEQNNPRHPAILRMIKMVVKAAHEKGKIVGICGEIAGDEKLIAEYISLGVDILSVSPHRILPLTKYICELD